MRSLVKQPHFRSDTSATGCMLCVPVSSGAGWGSSIRIQWLVWNAETTVAVWAQYAAEKQSVSEASQVSYRCCQPPHTTQPIHWIQKHLTVATNSPSLSISRSASDCSWGLDGIQPQPIAGDKGPKWGQCWLSPASGIKEVVCCQGRQAFQFFAFDWPPPCRARAKWESKHMCVCVDIYGRNKQAINIRVYYIYTYIILSYTIV